MPWLVPSPASHKLSVNCHGDHQPHSLGHNISITIQICWKIRFTLIQIRTYWSLWNFANDMSAVMACAKVCCNMMTRNWIAAKWDLHQLWVVMEKSLLKCVLGLKWSGHFWAEVMSGVPIRRFYWHYRDISWMLQCLRSLAMWQFVQKLLQTDNNKKAKICIIDHCSPVDSTHKEPAIQ